MTRIADTAFAVLSMAALLVACGPDDIGPMNGDCSTLLVGDVVITEVYPNPPGGDDGNEWLEIYNASSTPLNMRGVIIEVGAVGGDKKTHTMSEVVIPAGEYFVLGGVLDEFKPGYIDYAYAADFDMGNSGTVPQRVAVLCEGVIDEFVYTSPPDSKSLILSGTFNIPDHIANDDPDNICESTTEFVAGQAGTPGAKNDNCGNANQDECSDGGTVRPTAKPGAGDIEISEWIANPNAVLDDQGEWVELKINANIDLNGLQLGQAEPDTEPTPGPKSVSYTVVDSECLSFAAGTYVVLARNEDSQTNGGVVADLGLSMSLTNSNDGIFIGIDGTILDVVTWASTATGAATQIDGNGMTCDAVTPYGLGDLGTPGAANPECGVIPGGDECNDQDNGGAPRKIVPPEAGDLEIVEWMANPKLNSNGEEPPTLGTDGAGEWVEIIATKAVDLNGLEIGDATPADGQILSVDCIRLDVGERAVLTNNAMTATNGGLPPTAIEPDGWGALNNTGTPADSINLTFMGVTIATVSYNTVKNGIAVQVDDFGDQCDATATYGDGDFGTPGAANVADCTP